MFPEIGLRGKLRNSEKKTEGVVMVVGNMGGKLTRVPLKIIRLIHSPKNMRKPCMTPCLKLYFEPWDLKLIWDRVDADIIVIVAIATVGVHWVFLLSPI